MHFFGNYERSTASTGMSPQLPGKIGPSQWNFPNLSFGTQACWACSLFVASADSDNRQYGRNFDWEFSPGMLLYTNPTDAYASVSMVDITYLGYQGERAKTLSNLSLDERAGLLDAPFLPFDGMNEHGLVVGMAAVPPGSMRPDPDKPTIGSLGVIRKMLDHARNVNEATKILDSHNIDFTGGPPIHYLVADASGDAALVEFYQGAMVVLPNSGPWHAATNFLLSSVDGTTGTSCSRYNHINQRMQESGGV
jgi:penicillin V acylase-like amidase (Ntn superfamily)